MKIEISKNIGNVDCWHVVYGGNHKSFKDKNELLEFVKDLMETEEQIKAKFK